LTPHSHHAAFESVSVAAALILLGLVYARGCVRIRRLGLETIQGWRATSFITGLSLIWVAVASPLAALDHEFLTVHMIQHLLLMTLAPLLIWLGAPIKSLAHGVPHRVVQTFLIPLVCWPMIKGLVTFLSRPAVCWLGAAGTLIAWHIPAVFVFGLQSGTWHGIEQALFLGTGLLFWWPVIQPWPSAQTSPRWSMLVYLFLATLPCDILSGFLVFCDRVVYSVYLSTPNRFGISALEDQQCAAALMWTCVTIVYLLTAAILTTRLLSSRSTPESDLMELDLHAPLARRTGS
jgi:putative membrane protein